MLCYANTNQKDGTKILTLTCIKFELKSINSDKVLPHDNKNKIQQKEIIVWTHMHLIPFSVCNDRIRSTSWQIHNKSGRYLTHFYKKQSNKQDLIKDIEILSNSINKLDLRYNRKHTIFPSKH